MCSPKQQLGESQRWMVSKPSEKTRNQEKQIKCQNHVQRVFHEHVLKTRSSESFKLGKTGLWLLNKEQSEQVPFGAVNPESVESRSMEINGQRWWP